MVFWARAAYIGVSFCLISLRQVRQEAMKQGDVFSEPKLKYSKRGFGHSTETYTVVTRDSVRILWIALEH